MPEENPEVSRCLAWGMDLPEFLGKVFRLGEPTQGVKAEFEAYLKRQAMQNAILASEGLPEAEKEANRRILMKDFACGAYRWGGPVWQEAITSQDTVEELIVLLLREGEAKKSQGLRNAPTREVVRGMLDDPVLGPWVMAAVFLVSGVDPTLALAMGRMSYSRAKEQQMAAAERIEQLLTPSSAETSSKTSPPSGETFPG